MKGALRAEDQDILSAYSSEQGAVQVFPPRLWQYVDLPPLKDSHMHLHKHNSLTGATSN